MGSSENRLGDLEQMMRSFGSMDLGASPDEGHPSSRPLASTPVASPSQLLKGSSSLENQEDESNGLDNELDDASIEKESKEKTKGFTPDLLAAYRSFDCSKATRQACSLKASKDVPFSLAFLDEFWKEGNGGKLPDPEGPDVRAFSLARWKDKERAEGYQAIEMGLPPPFPKAPSQDDLKKLYIPNLDRRQFYCWKMRSDPEFCRLLKVKAMAVAGPTKKGLKVCGRLSKCLSCWANHSFSKEGLERCSRDHKCLSVMPYFGVDLNHDHAKHRFAGMLYLLYKQVGGKVSRNDMEKKGGMLVYLAELLKPSWDVNKSSKSPIELLDPSDEKIRQAFCEAVANQVEAKATISFPSLSLPPAQYRAEIDKIFGRFTYPTPTFKNGCQWNPLKLTKLTQHQKFMGAYMTPKTPAKGILMDHAAGTGKTCAAVAALSNFVSLGGKKDKEGWKVIWVTRPKLVPDVGDAVYGLGCLSVLRDAIRDNAQSFGNAKTFISKLNYAKDKGSWGALEAHLGHGFELKTNVLKYSQFVNSFTYTGEKALPGILKTKYAVDLFRKGPDPIRKTLLILDEAHNLFNTTDLPSTELTYMDGKKSGHFGKDIPGREHIINLIQNSYKVSGKDSCRLILATATPMTKSPVDAFRLLNLLIPDPKHQLPSTMKDLKAYRTKGGQPFVDAKGFVTDEAKEEFKQRTNGIISYFAGNRNPEYFAMKEFHIVNVPISSVQEHYLKKCIEGYKKKKKQTKAKTKAKDGAKAKAKDGNKLWSGLKKKLGWGPKDSDFFEGGETYGESFHPSGGTPAPKPQPKPSKTKKDSFFEGGPEGADYGEVFYGDEAKEDGETKKDDQTKKNDETKKDNQTKKNGETKKDDQTLPSALPLVSDTAVKDQTKPEEVVKVKKERRPTRVKSVIIPEGLTKAARKKVETCMRNKSIVAAMRGKLMPLDKEAEAFRETHHAKEREREAKERQAYVKKHGISQDQIDKIKAWKEWETMEDDGHPGPKPKEPSLIETWKVKESKRKAKMDAKPSGRKPTKAMLAKYEANLKGEVGDAMVFRRKATPKMKEGKTFNFNFDGKSATFTPQLLKDALASYGPKLQALFDKIDELDRRDLKTHGRLFKHSIYTDTAGQGYGSKIVAAAFMAFGFQMACSYKKVMRADGKPERNAAKELILELEPPEKTVGRCKGNLPPEADTFAKGHTFCVLSSTVMDYFLDGKVERDSNPSVTKATTDLYNCSENDGKTGEGKLVRFIVLDSGFKEGVSLANVRYAHLLEPPLMEASLKQAVARSIRFCKSTLLKDYAKAPEGWWVDVYVFRSVYPAFMDDPDGGTKEEPSTIHQAILDSLGEEEAKEARMMGSFDNLLKESAVDYALNGAILTYSPPGIKMSMDEAAKALHLA